VALSSFGLPSTIDLHPKLNATLDLSDGFDGVSFDSTGGLLTAGALVSHSFGANDPGATAPGWLSTAKPLGTMNTSPAFGLALSFDLVNQTLFAIWGQNGLALPLPNVPLVGTLQAAPALPPVLLPDSKGGVSLGLGEVILKGMIQGQPVTAAVTVRTELTVTLMTSPSALALVPMGTPEISLTWLSASGVSDQVKQAIAAAAPQTIATMIPAIQIPLPSIPLDAVASSLAGKSATLATGSQVLLDAPSSHVYAYGDFVIN